MVPFSELFSPLVVLAAELMQSIRVVVKFTLDVSELFVELLSRRCSKTFQLDVYAHQNLKRNDKQMVSHGR